MKLREVYYYIVTILNQIEEEYFAQKETREILSHLLNLPPLHLFLYPELEISEDKLSQLSQIIEERLRLKPLPYILKKAYFFGRPFYVEEGVLIPRQETEVLIEVALEELKKRKLLKDSQGTFLEIGCGSGILSITLLLEAPILKAYATDLSSKAIKITLINGKNYRVLERLYLLKGNLFSSFKRAPLFDFVISNPPYLSEREWKELSREVRDFEPKEALVAGPLGTEFQEALLKEAHAYLKKGGFLIFEMGYNQASKIKELAIKYQWSYKFYKDLLNYERVALLWKEDML